jgi:asparagine synthase (glutamine-hydrolysing)
MTADFASDQAQSQPYRELIDQCASARGLVGRHPLHQSLYLWCKSILPNYALAGERLEMANGVEVRLPFLDHRLFEMIRRLPVALLVKQGEQKRVLREMLKPLLPASMRARPKRPFAAAPSTTRRASPLVTLMTTLMEEPDARPPFFDVTAIRRLRSALPALDAGTLGRLDPIIHTITGLCLMQRHFKPAP